MAQATQLTARREAMGCGVGGLGPSADSAGGLRLLALTSSSSVFSSVK